MTYDQQVALIAAILTHASTLSRFTLYATRGDKKVAEYNWPTPAEVVSQAKALVHEAKKQCGVT